MTVRILRGDVREKLRELAADSVDCVVTSPPYWGLRDYGVEGQIGMEATLAEHLSVLVDVFAEVRRVMKPQASLWLNYGDCYATTANGRSAADTKAAGNDDRTFRDKPFSTIGGALKPKDLAMVANRLAIALQAPRHVGPIKVEADRAWLAGIIDADGCIGIRREDNSADGWNDSFIPYLTVGCSDRSMLDRCVQVTGLGRVNLKSRAGTVSRSIVSRRDHYTWRLDGQIASRVIRDIFPYLIVKKTQASVVNALNESQSSFGPGRFKAVPPEKMSYRTALYEGIKSLNQRHPVTLPALPGVKPNFEQGWWVRSEIVWGKNNPMPDSSGKYRPSTAHEKIWLLTKSAKSFYDAEAVALPCSEATHAPLAQNIQDQIGSARANGGRKTNGNMKAVIKKQDGHGRPHEGFNERYFGPKIAKAGSGVRNNDSMDAALAIMPETRYLRNYEPAPVDVWEMSAQPFSDAHFATFPPELVRRAILAGCPERGTVLDPFGGAGTTGLVADRMGRDAILIELNNEYADLAERRIKGDCPMFAEVAA